MKKIITVLLISTSGLLMSGCDWLFDFEDNESADYTAWEILVSRYPEFNGFPPMAGSITFLEYNNDNPFLTWIEVAVTTKNAEAYIKVLKNNKFKKPSGEHNFDVQYMSPDRIRQYWRYVGFYKPDAAGVTKIMFSNLP